MRRRTSPLRLTRAFRIDPFIRPRLAHNSLSRVLDFGLVRPSHDRHAKLTIVRAASLELALQSGSKR